MTKLTIKDFEWYKDEVGYWMRFLGCFEWECRYSFIRDDDALATVTCSAENGLAHFTLAKKWELDIVNKRAISRSAFHEACEVLLNKMSVLNSVKFSEPFVSQETHRVIRKLENTVFVSEYGHRFPKEL